MQRNIPSKIPVTCIGLIHFWSLSATHFCQNALHSGQRETHFCQNGGHAHSITEWSLGGFFVVVFFHFEGRSKESQILDSIFWQLYFLAGCYGGQKQV